MARPPKKDRVPIGVYIDRVVHAEAVRVAEANELTVTQILRMAINRGLPMVAAHLTEDGEAA